MMMIRNHFSRFSLPKFIVTNHNQSVQYNMKLIEKRRERAGRQRDDKVFPFGLYMHTFLMPPFILEYTYQQQQTAIQSIYICQYKQRKENCNMTCEWQHRYYSLLSLSSITQNNQDFTNMKDR